MSGPTLRLALVAVAAFLPAEVRANCARPVGYDVSVVASTVTVQPSSGSPAGCGGDVAMLRQDVASGATVALATWCALSPDPYEGDAYVDECVPAGTYRYGFAEPFACCETCCGTYRYEKVTVTTALDPGCQRGEGNPGPTPVDPVAWGVPMGGGELICGYGHADFTNLGSWGCSTAAGSGAVLLLDAAALALGVGLLRRRRGARRG
jgi:hypothetical protein